MPFKAYLFDLDGTLLDSIRLILDSFHHARRVHFGDARPDADYLRTLGMPLRDVFQTMATESISVQTLVDTYVQFNIEHHDTSVGPYEGITDVLEQLAAAGTRLAVVTSKINLHAARGLAVLDVAKYFELLIGADDVVRAKPHPEPVQKALEHMGIEPADAVFIGDSPHDVTAGNGAGVRTAAATWGPFSRDSLAAARPTYLLERPADILELEP